MKRVLFLLMTVMVLPFAQAEQAAADAMAAQQAVPQTVEHHYKQGETLWFISLLYYGKGGQFNKIIEANHLASAEALHDGQVLKIPQTTWKTDTAEFKAHYQEVWDKHQGRLKGPAPVTAAVADKAMPSKDDTVVVKVQAKASHKKTPGVEVADDSAEASKVLVVPIPSSPIFPAGEVPAAGDIPGHRSAAEDR